MASAQYPITVDDAIANSDIKLTFYDCNLRIKIDGIKSLRAKHWLIALAVVMPIESC